MKKKTALDKIFNSRIFWVAFSLVTAVILWMYVITTENVTVTEPYTIPVEFKGEAELKEKKGLVITDVSATTVSVRLTGNKRDMAKLKESNLFATIDVSSYMRSEPMTRDYNITTTADVNMDDISDVKLSPAITFYVDIYDTKMFEVVPVFEGKVVDPYIQKSLVAEPGTVKISGAKREIDMIDHARVVISRQDVDKTIDDYFSYDLVDEDGEIVELPSTTTIEKEHDVVQVILTVQLTKQVELSVTVIDGGGATMANLRAPVFEPAHVILAGDPEVLEAYNEINVGQIDLASFALTAERPYQIPLPNGTECISGEREVTVKFEITGLVVKEFNVTNFTIINAPDGFEPEAVTKSLLVTVRAPEHVMSLIQASNIKVTVDLSEEFSEVEPVEGNRSYTPKISVDGFLEAGIVFDHYKVIVSLTAD